MSVPKYFVLVSIFSLLIQGYFSTTLKVDRNVKSADEVENKGCASNGCTRRGLKMHCTLGDCCKCGCPSDKPNYIVGIGLCKSNNYLKQNLPNADCKYDFGLGGPLKDLQLVKNHTGSEEFLPKYNPKYDVDCNYTIQAKKWKHLDAFAKWQDGDQDIFTVDNEARGLGYPKNDYILKALEWSAALKPKYSGVLIKISITCGHDYLGCVLAKVSGSKTYDITNVPKPPPQVITTPTTTTTTLKPTTNIILSTTPAKNESEVKHQVDNNSNNNSASNAALIPALASVAGAILLALIIVAAIIYYRRKQKRNSDPENSAFANTDYDRDPIYAEVNKDNAVYSDPALDANNMRKSVLGPLPSIPGTESAYQPLDSMTRKIEDSSAEADYDNPPVNSKSNDVSADYDNPPVQGTPGNNSDYDNPPPMEGGEGEKNDYDVPPNNAELASTNDEDVNTDENLNEDDEDTAL